MVMERLRKVIKRNPSPLEDEAKLEHCHNCDGDCPLINGCC